MSFVTNVNYLAQHYLELCKLAGELTPENLAVLENFAKVDVSVLETLTKDLSLGTSVSGKRKIDINLFVNMQDGSTHEVEYSGATIYLDNGHMFEFAFLLPVVLTLDPNKPVDVAFAGYTSLVTAIKQGIEDNNYLELLPDKQVHNVKFDVLQEVNGGHPRLIRVTDAGMDLTGLASIQLHVEPASATYAKDQAPTFTWATTTSALKLLVPYLPQFVKDTQVWAQVASKNPLPGAKPGVLTNNGSGVLSWTNGQFMHLLSGNVDITKGYSDNHIDPLEVTLGAIAEVHLGGLPNADWKLVPTDDVPRGTLLIFSGSGWRVMDDSNYARAMLDTVAHPNPNIGQIGYDTRTNRMVIGLPTAAGLDPTNTTDPQAGWVDASPALTPGDLSAIMAVDGDIAAGAENSKAVSPKQVHDYLFANYATKNSLDSLATDSDFKALDQVTQVNVQSIQALETKYDKDIPDIVQGLSDFFAHPKLPGLPVYADEAAALAASLPSDSLYKTPNGEIRIKL